ncbi:hypothetical protein FJZ33_04930 [Candidatus Poribacteria bacterium]|nr:hypothetical protein [Candidatus Poribacteria bacterium]
MIVSAEEKEILWNKVLRDFPSDTMMRDLHFIRELIFALKEKEKDKTYKELSEMARKEFIEWLKFHPEVKN